MDIPNVMNRSADSIQKRGAAANGIVPVSYTHLRFIAIAADKATPMGHIKREELAKAEVLIPCEEDYTSLTSIMQPIFELIISNRISDLVHLRLPPAYSGFLLYHIPGTAFCRYEAADKNCP